ncbi:MAG TPA: MBL fold metallo-hydrolase [Solirubrobacteraceae bacterium]|nr:MBL fold metallo-hydrolase [Solirubrobacteraceae bacterium]
MAHASERTGSSTGRRALARRELGRGERVLPGVYRLRLPLPWPGVPHCNAWAVRAGDGVVLFDTGMHQPDSLAHLERALEMCGLALEQVRLVVCTHAHSDHYGQAATIVERTGCELWMHPNHEHMKRMAEDPDAVLDRRIEVARHSGVPEEPLRQWASQRRARDSGIAGVIEPDRDLCTGITIDTDLGSWVVHETPGHAPSHVCLFQPERRLLISGDHLLGRISLYFDYGYTPDPVGEFCNSLGVVEHLGARLCLPGHGRTFADVQAHINGNRALVRERLQAVLGAVGETPLTAFEIVPHVYGQSLSGENAHWLLSKVLCFLAHLRIEGRVRSLPGEPERWVA